MKTELMAKAIKKPKKQRPSINASFEDIIKASVSGNPKPKPKVKKTKAKIEPISKKDTI